MMKLFIVLFLFFAVTINAQSVIVNNFSGSVQIQSGKDGKSVIVKRGLKLEENSVVSTGKNSSLNLKAGSTEFTLKSSSSINVNSLKKMSADEFLLALAKESLLPAKQAERDNVDYIKMKTDWKKPFIETDDAGVKKLNGAVQLAAAGFRNQAFIAAKEAYRKHPALKKIPAFRLFFAGILPDNKLYDEAYSEYSEIKKLDLDGKEKNEVEEKLLAIKKKLPVK